MLFLDFDERCRLCLAKAESMVPLFIDDGAPGPTLCDRIENCTFLKIVNCDGLPSTMCNGCLSKLDLIKDFQEQCQQSDTALREHLQAFVAEKEREENLQCNASTAEVQNSHSSSNEAQTDQCEANVCEIGMEIPNQIEELALLNDQKDTVSQPIRPRSGRRKNKKVSPPLTDILDQDANDNQENDLSLEDNEYRWPGSLSDEEFGPKPQDSNNSDANQKKRSKVYECEYCGRKFTRSNHLAQHELTHTKDEPFHCYYCNKGFWYKNSLIGHIKQNHTGDVNYTCEECGRGFFQRSEYMRHKPIHSNETPFKCEECGMSFKLMKNLRRHQKVHTGTRTHTCQYCGKSFRMLQTLRVHLITHTGEKPFKCEHCGRGFSQSAPLKAHIRSLHTGEKPYTCDMCGEAFPTGNTLKSHVFKHTGIHPFSCNSCSIVFRRKKDLLAHQDSVHGGFVTSPVKVPPQLPLHEVLSQDQVNTPEAASTASTISLDSPQNLCDPSSSPAPSELITLKLEPTTVQHISVQPHLVLSGDDSISDNDSMSVSTLPPLPLSLLQRPSPMSSPLMSPSSEDLLATDLTITFS